MVQLEVGRRFPLASFGGTLAPGARLGVSFQDHDAVALAAVASGAGDDAESQVLTTDNRLTLLVPEVGIEAMLFPGWTGGASYGVGIHLPGFGQVAQHARLEAHRQVNQRVGIRGAMEIWTRHLTARRADTGAEVGRLEDVWARLTGSLEVRM
jgi:hypothetical protein